MPKYATKTFSRNKPRSYNINWGHPLMKRVLVLYILDQGAGNRIIDATKVYNATMTSSFSWKSALKPIDFGINCTTGSDANTRLAVTSSKITAPGAFTLMLWIRITAKHATQNAPLWGVYPGSGSPTSPFEQYSLYCLTASGNLAIFHSIGGSELSIDTGVAIDDSKVHQLVVTWDGATIKSYIDSIQKSSTARGGLITPQSSVLGLGNIFTDINRSVSATYGTALISTRAWRPEEVRQSYVDPYCFINKPRVFFSIPTAAQTAIAFDSASNSGYQAAQSTYTWNHTCTGTNRFLSVDISLLSAGATVSSITYNSVALSLIVARSTVTSFGRVESWGLANPTSGTNVISVTLSSSIASSGEAVSYTYVHQTSPTEGADSNQATNVGAADATVSITSVADKCWIHAAVATSDSAITAGQTTRNNVTGAGGSGADEDTGPITPAGATSMSYTDVGALATWTIAGYAIRPVGSSTLGGVSLNRIERKVLRGVGRGFLRGSN